MTENTIPTGYRKDKDGRLIPESLIKPIDELRDRTVAEIVSNALALHDRIKAFKDKCFGEIAAFVSISAEQYDVKIGGTKGNVALVSFDGKYKVIRQIQEHICFDERLHVAKQLIDECISEWSAGSDDKIIALVNDAFQVNKEGLIDSSRVLGLRRLKISDDKWLKAMQAIADSVQATGSKSYVRIYQRDDETGRYHLISLDIAGM